MSKKEIPGKRNCKTCQCPLMLLRLERRRYENRFVCTRCGESKIRNLLIANPAQIAAASRAVYGSRKKTKSKNPGTPEQT